jgi:hypothetical protein
MILGYAYKELYIAECCGIWSWNQLRVQIRGHSSWTDHNEILLEQKSISRPKGNAACLSRNSILKASTASNMLCYDRQVNSLSYDIIFYYQKCELQATCCLILVPERLSIWKVTITLHQDCMPQHINQSMSSSRVRVGGRITYRIVAARVNCYQIA